MLEAYITCHSLLSDFLAVDVASYTILRFPCNSFISCFVYLKYISWPGNSYHLTWPLSVPVLF